MLLSKSDTPFELSARTPRLESLVIVFAGPADFDRDRQIFHWRLDCQSDLSFFIAEDSGRLLHESRIGPVLGRPLEGRHTR